MHITDGFNVSSNGVLRVGKNGMIYFILYLFFVRQNQCIIDTYPLHTATLQLSERIEVSSENAQRLEKDLLELIFEKPSCSAQRVGFFNIGSGRVGYWTKYWVAGRVRVG